MFARDVMPALVQIRLLSATLAYLRTVEHTVACNQAAHDCARIHAHKMCQMHNMIAYFASMARIICMHCAIPWNRLCARPAITSMCHLLPAAR